MADVAYTNLTDKCRRHYRGERRKDPNKPPLVAGAGRVIANGSLKVELLCADGTRPTYVATSTMGWTFTAAPTVRKLHALSPKVEASLSDKARAALNTVLDVLAAAEQHLDSDGGAEAKTIAN